MISEGIKSVLDSIRDLTEGGKVRWYLDGESVTGMGPDGKERCPLCMLANQLAGVKENFNAWVPKVRDVTGLSSMETTLFVHGNDNEAAWSYMPVTAEVRAEILKACGLEEKAEVKSV